MTGSGRATIKDIARVAGVSTASVSQALRPRSDSNIKLQEETVERIKLVALQLNYRPHAGARSIRSKQFGTLGYFAAKQGLYTHTPDGYMAGVHDAAEKRSFRITLIRLPHQIEEIKDSIPSVFTEHNLDALVIESYSEISDKIHSHLKNINLPVIYLNDKHETNSVFVDDIEGSSQITQHMIDRGFQNLCFVLRKNPKSSGMMKDMHHSAQDRKTGYEQTMVANGLKPEVRTIESEVAGQNADLNEGQWDELKQFNGLLAYDDDLANAIGRVCYRKGIRIPEDVALAGFNGDYGSLCSWKPLTTVKIPSYEMGCDATEMALKLIQYGNQSPVASQSHQASLIIGETT